MSLVDVIVLQTIPARLYAYHHSLIYSYTAIKDLEGKGYLTSKTAGNDLWPKLLFQYSSTGHHKKLDMVKGEFTAASSPAALSLSAGASSSSAGASAAASQSATRPATWVKVKSYISNGRLCYSWKSGNIEDRSFADAWSTRKDQDGNDIVLHRVKNLVSVPP